jgi:arginyl-tRNA synthetase
MGALKYFLLKVDPKKRMLFNPEESIDFQGNTGPFIQYTHARIKSIVRKANELNIQSAWTRDDSITLAVAEQELVYLVAQYKLKIQEAANQMAPSVIAQYVYDLAKQFNKFYNELSIINEEDALKQKIRLSLVEMTGKTIQHAALLLGVVVPERM